MQSSFTVRRIASGVGVEKTFPLHSPNVVKVERVKSSKVRQARLYYLRERSGRTARMSGETREGAAWDESSQEETNVEKLADSSETKTEETEATEENDTENQTLPAEDTTESKSEASTETSEAESAKE
jgi:large subunit ribosomal protein L19